MKKLTKKERHSIYVLALVKYKRRIEEGLHFGLCDAIEGAAWKIFGWDNYPDPYDNMEGYPEIAKYKAEGDGTYWFSKHGDGIQKRINILEQAIKETE